MWLVTVLYSAFVNSSFIYIFNTSTGSSQGRGSRAASWFADYIQERKAEGDVSALESLALEGGIKGWVKAGDEYVQMMDGYDEAVWKK